MSDNQPKVITSRQARAQINHFGRSLILYMIFLTVLRYGTGFVFAQFPELPLLFDQDYLILSALIILTILTAVIAFGISSKVLSLDIRDYMKWPQGLTAGTMVSLSCIGIGVYMLAVSVSTLFYYFVPTANTDYAFLGLFTTWPNIVKNILYFVYLVLVKAICEEYMFRGVIQRQLGHYGRYFGVLGSTLLYALSQPSLARAFSSFLIGWFLSLVTLKYHSIRPVILIHIALSLFTWFMDIIPGSLIWLAIVLIFAVYIIAALSLISQRISTSMVRWGATEWKLWKILLTSWTTIVVILLFAVNVYLSLRA